MFPLGFVVVGSIAVRWLEHSRLHHRWHQEAKWETLVGGCLAAVVVAALFAWIGSRLLNRTIGTLMAAASGGLAMVASGPVPGILLGALTGCVVTRGWGWLALRFLFRTCWVAAGGALSAALIHRVWQGAGESSPGVLWTTFALLGALQLAAAVSARRRRGERMPGIETTVQSGRFVRNSDVARLAGKLVAGLGMWTGICSYRNSSINGRERSVLSLRGAGGGRGRGTEVLRGWPISKRQRLATSARCPN